MGQRSEASSLNEGGNIEGWTDESQEDAYCIQLMEVKAEQEIEKIQEQAVYRKWRHEPRLQSDQNLGKSQYFNQSGNPRQDPNGCVHGRWWTFSGSEPWNCWVKLVKTRVMIGPPSGLTLLVRSKLEHLRCLRPAESLWQLAGLRDYLRSSCCSDRKGLTPSVDSLCGVVHKLSETWSLVSRVFQKNKKQNWRFNQFDKNSHAWMNQSIFRVGSAVGSEFAINGELLLSV